LQTNASTSAGAVTSQPQQQTQQQQSQQQQSTQQQQQQSGVQTRRKPNHAPGANPGTTNPDYPMDAVLTLMQLNAGWRAD